MALFFLSFFAGVLTVLAPCTLPLLPIILGGSLSEAHHRGKAVVITLSLAISLILFTLVLKVSTVFIDVPQTVWSYISGGIIMVIGLLNVFPELWEKISFKFGLGQKSNTALAHSAQKKNYWGDVLIGASLGPVFSSCSPTYFLILATVLPQSFGEGFLYLVSYAVGLSLMLLLIAFVGQKLVGRLRFAADPNGLFRRGIGVLFLLVGVCIVTGFDQRFQVYVSGKSLFDVTKIEGNFLQKLNK